MNFIKNILKFKNMKRTIYLIIVTIILALFAASCGVSDHLSGGVRYSEKQLNRRGYKYIAPMRKGSHYIRRTNDSTKVNIIKIN